MVTPERRLVQLVIVLDGQLDVSRHNPRLLVVTSGVSSQLEDLSSQVFENGSQVDRGTSTNTTSVTTTAKLRVNTTDRELETGLGRTRDSLRARSRSASRLSFQTCCSFEVGEEEKGFWFVFGSRERFVVVMRMMRPNERASA